MDITGAHHRPGYIEEDLKELESRLSLDISAGLGSRASLLHLATRVFRDVHEKADARGLRRLYRRLRALLVKLDRIIPSVRGDIEKKGWRTNPWLSAEIDSDSLYYTAAMDHLEFLRGDTPLELSYEDFNSTFPWEVLERIGRLMEEHPWDELFTILLRDYRGFLKAPDYYEDLIPLSGGEAEAFYWTGDLVIEILSDIMERNLSALKEEKERALMARVEDLRAKVSGLPGAETREELTQLLNGIAEGTPEMTSCSAGRDRFLELSLLEIEVEDLLVREENLRLYRAGDRWELFQSTPRSWFI
jgi:hypothetical protein